MSDAVSFTFESASFSAKPSVSIIVPVYNVEEYLPRCIDSLIHQTLQEIEILLIDDGSTDRSGQICDEYAAKDPRIQVVHQKNAGLSGARNAGIDRARAEHLMFVDSDDWVEPDFCKTPLALAKENHADLVMFQYRIANGKDTRRYPAVPDGIKTSREANHLLTTVVKMYAWNKLYHRRLFADIRYPVGRVYEDKITTPVLIHSASRIVYSSQILYNYRLHPASITRIQSQKNISDCFYATELAVQNMRDWGYGKDATEYYSFCLYDFLTSHWEKSEYTEKCIRYFRCLKHCPDWMSKKQRLMLYLLLLSPSLFHAIYKFHKRKQGSPA